MQMQLHHSQKTLMRRQSFQRLLMKKNHIQIIHLLFHQMQLLSQDLLELKVVKIIVLIYFEYL